MAVDVGDVATGTVTATFTLRLPLAANAVAFGRALAGGLARATSNGSGTALPAGSLLGFWVEDEGDVAGGGAEGLEVPLDGAPILAAVVGSTAPPLTVLVPAVGATEARPALAFELYPGDATRLRYSWADVYRMQYLAAHSGLHRVSPGAVTEALFAAAGTARALTRDAYLALVAELVPGRALPRLTRHYLSATFSALLDVVARRTGLAATPAATAGSPPTATPHAALVDLLAPLLLLAAGSKSEKLASLWAAAGALSGGIGSGGGGGDGDTSQPLAAADETALTRYKLWRLFRALLAPLTLLSSAVAGDADDRRAALATAVDDAALECAQAVFAQWGGAAPAGAGGQPAKALTFDQFGRLYNTSGFALLWIELFDNRKWPRVDVVPCLLPAPPSLPRASTSAPSSRRLPAAAPPAAPPTAPPASPQPLRLRVGSLPPGGAPGSTPVVLTLHAGDVAAHAAFLAATGLAHVPVRSLLTSVMAPLPAGAAAGGTTADALLDATGLDVVLARLVDTHALADDAVEGVLRVMYALAGLVGNFRPSGSAAGAGAAVPWSAVAHQSDLAVALAFFAAGTKTSKLRECFAFLAGAPDAPLPRRALIRLARALLCSLLLFSDGLLSRIVAGEFYRSAAAGVCAMADAAAVEVVTTIFAGASRASPDAVALEELADLYNSELAASFGPGGTFECLAWLELLDTGKWADMGAQAAHRSGAAAAATAAAPPSDRDDITTATCFGVPLPVVEAGGDGGSGGGARYVWEVDGAPLAFRFSVRGAEGEPTTTFALPRGTAVLLAYVAAATELAGMASAALLPIVLGAVGSDARAADHRTFRQRLPRAAFMEVVRTLVPNAAVAARDRLPLSTLFLRLFDALDFRGDRSVAVGDVALALSLFTRGSKSDKLSLAFHLYGRKRSGGRLRAMQRVELFRFLRALFAAFAVLQEAGAELEVAGVAAAGGDPPLVRLRTAGQRGEMVEGAATLHAAAFLDAAGAVPTAGMPAALTFDDVSRFYNDGGGYEVAPYLELLSLRKWGADAADSVAHVHAVLAAVSAPVAPRSGGTQQRAAVAPSAPPAEDAGDADDEDDDERVGSASAAATAVGAVVALECPLLRGDSSAKLSLSAGACFTVAQVAVVTGLASVYPPALLSALSTTVTHGVITRAEYSTFLDALLEAAAPPSADREELLWARGLLSLLFDAFDLDGTGTVMTVELGVALLLFTAGSKSDKVAPAWAALDNDGDGKLSELEVALLLRSVLLTLLTMATMADMVYLPPAAASYAHFLDRLAAAVSVAERVAMAAKGEVEAAVGSFPVAFQDFAGWYNGDMALAPGASATALSLGVPWLELLDLRKWPGAASAPAAPAAPAAVDASMDVPAAADAPAPAAAGNDTVFEFELPPATAQTQTRCR